MYQRDQDTQKSLLAKAAIKYLEKGMVLGLVTGSTIDIFILELSKFESLFSSLKIVATSKISAKTARDNRMNVVAPDKYLELDICIDGADEVYKRQELESVFIWQMKVSKSLGWVLSLCP